jgi:PAS domain S-box-containing protein
MAPNGRLLTTQRYEWVAKGITSQIDNPLMQNLDVMTAGFRRWVKTLTKGQVLYGNIRDFPANERKILSAQNILSIVIVPIFSEQTLWGFIGFDECLVEREWTRIELDTLKAAASIIGSAIQHKQIEKVLHESEEKYRSLVENVNVSVYRNTAEPRGRFLEINPAMVRMFGYKSSEELMQYSVADLYENHLDRKIFLDKIKKKDSVKNEELRLKKKDGTKIIASVTASAHRNTSGKIDWFDGVIEDITERKKAEQALRESEERYRTIFETANDGICIFDTAGNAISGNQRLLELTGMSEKDFGSHISKYPIFPQNSLEIIKEKMAARFAGKKVGPYEVEIYPTNGTPKTVEINATLLRYPNGEVWGDLAIIRDITERKQYETTLKQAKETAENANKAKTSFLHNMSHELRSPMTSILGFTDLLIDKEENTEKKEMLEIVNNSSSHLLKIINDLLDLSRIEAGKMILEKIKCNICDAVQKTYKSFEPLAKQKGIDLILNINKNLPEFIMTDYTKINQIISNLLDNAFKFTERGKIELYIGLKTPVKPNENILEFYVNDTGIGIADEHKEQIFEKFVQGEHYISKKYGGAGLGLPIVKELVELMQGKISVKSKLAKGTKFTVQIPIEIK